jgi:hypothetical protein
MDTAAGERPFLSCGVSAGLNGYRSSVGVGRCSQAFGWQETAPQDPYESAEGVMHTTAQTRLKEESSSESTDVRVL